MTWWLEELKQGDETAATALWQRYFHRLKGLARQRLREGNRRTGDEEDIALSAFQSLCEGAERGRFDELKDRDDLWRLLATISARKVSRMQRDADRQKRGAGLVRGHSVLEGEKIDAVGFDQFVSDEPTPEFMCQLAEEHDRLLAGLQDERLVLIARGRLEGFSTVELAEQLGISRRSVERKLERIREYWKEELS